MEGGHSGLLVVRALPAYPINPLPSQKSHDRLVFFACRKEAGGTGELREFAMRLPLPEGAAKEECGGPLILKLPPRYFGLNDDCAVQSIVKLDAGNALMFGANAYPSWHFTIEKNEGD
ncbi:MAG: hypothetical protein WC861_06990 [Candidatus Micrarchaeia archaeon]